MTAEEHSPPAEEAAPIDWSPEALPPPTLPPPLHLKDFLAADGTLKALNIGAIVNSLESGKRIMGIIKTLTEYLRELTKASCEVSPDSDTAAEVAEMMEEAAKAISPSLGLIVDNLQTLESEVDKANAEPRNPQSVDHDEAIAQARAAILSLVPYADLDYISSPYGLMLPAYGHITLSTQLLLNALRYCPPSDSPEVQELLRSYHDAMHAICYSMRLAIDGNDAPAPLPVTPLSVKSLMWPLDKGFSALHSGVPEGPDKGEGLINTGEFRADLNNNDGIRPYVTYDISYDGPADLCPGGKVGTYDLRIYAAVASIIQSTFKSTGQLARFTARSVYEVSTAPDFETQKALVLQASGRPDGRTRSAPPKPEALKRVTDSIDRWRKLLVCIDDSGAVGVWDREIEKVRYSENALALRSVELTLMNGSRVVGYEALSVPVLLQHAMALGQVAKIPLPALLTLKWANGRTYDGPASTTDTRADIAAYIELRVQKAVAKQEKYVSAQQYSKKWTPTGRQVLQQSPDRTILLATLWKEADCIPEPRGTERARLLKFIEDKLITDVKLGRLKSYRLRQAKKSRSYDAIIFELPPPADLQKHWDELKAQREKDREKTASKKRSPQARQ